MKWTKQDIDMIYQVGVEYKNTKYLAGLMGRSPKSVESKIYWLKCNRNNVVIIKG